MKKELTDKQRIMCWAAVSFGLCKLGIVGSKEEDRAFWREQENIEIKQHNQTARIPKKIKPELEYSGFRLKDIPGFQEFCESKLARDYVKIRGGDFLADAPSFEMDLMAHALGFDIPKRMIVFGGEKGKPYPQLTANPTLAELENRGKRKLDGQQ
jgi:hypothetical protein